MSAADRPFVVGVDRSTDGHRALEWAVEEALALGVPVIAVHAVGLLEHHSDDPTDRHVTEDVSRWTTLLEQLPAGRAERRAVPGDPVSVLLRVATEVGARALVVGTRGEGARTGVILGSTSLQLAERAPCPVVIIPPGA